MSEYWKSTPSYWCKFCSQYVRDTSLEKKNHEASARHQNNIQRSLRQLHKDKQIEERDKQRAKDEVTRLNGMFSADGKQSSSTKPSSTPTAKSVPTAPPALNTAAQRKAHAEQLAALGVELPDELKKEVTGVGSFQVVDEHAVESSGDGSVTVNRSLAEILAESKKEEGEVKEEVKTEEEIKATAKGVFKRKAEDDEDIRDEEAAPKRKAWGSNFKAYPGSKGVEEDVGDLDALLSGVKSKKEPDVKTQVADDGEVVKNEEVQDESKPIDAVPDVSASGNTAEKMEGNFGATAPPTVVFKKRKGKK